MQLCCQTNGRYGLIASPAGKETSGFANPILSNNVELFATVFLDLVGEM